MDEAKWLGGYGLLQPASGSDLNIPRPRDGYSRLAVPTRSSEIEGRPIVAPRACVYLKRDDWLGLVGAFPRAAAGRSLAQLPPGG